MNWSISSTIFPLDMWVIIIIIISLFILKRTSSFFFSLSLSRLPKRNELTCTLDLILFVFVICSTFLKKKQQLITTLIRTLFDLISFWSCYSRCLNWDERETGLFLILLLSEVLRANCSSCLAFPSIFYSRLEKSHSVLEWLFKLTCLYS